MDKFGVDESELLSGLRNEESELMTKVAAYMMIHEKTASEATEYSKLENRLQQVRDKITELDTKKLGE
jgi:septation ring formation regulator EzrA